MKLHVCLEGRVAGTLDASGGRARLAYSEDWLSARGAYPLSQTLPLRSSPHVGNNVTNFLWGLLPDNELTVASWAQRFNVSAQNPIALLARVGEDCAGAVQLIREERLEEILAEESLPPQVQWLTDREVAMRMRHLVRDVSASRENREEGQFSLSGSQAKTAFFYDTDLKRWGIPRGRTPTTHIFKPVSNGLDGFAENEHFCLCLARRVGLSSAGTEWHFLRGIPTLVVERYDRLQLDRRWHRIHQEDACQALGIHPSLKSESENGPGLKEILSLLNGSDEPAVDRERLLKSVCFLYFLAATNAHSKNLSLLYSRGANRLSMRLSPLYDAASAWPYPRQIPVETMQLAMRVGGESLLKEITPQHFVDLAKDCGFQPDAMLAILHDLARRLPQEAEALLKQLDAPHMAPTVLKKLVEGIALKCETTLRQLSRF
jgi:serine/threonine-protein kinase HipA